MTSLYIHIPFCQKKCLYCSFVISVGQEKRMEEYVKCLIREFEIFKNNRVDTVYIGGGTPSCLTASQLCFLFEGIRKNFDLSHLKEWTCELNPEDVNTEKLRVLKNYGVNRISFGAQSMDDVRLKNLGRVHNASKIIEAYDMIRQEGFDNVNVDLIFSLPNQSFEELQSDVHQICKLNSEHLSLYSLTIEKNSYFFNRKVNVGSLESQAKYYREVCRLLCDYGFQQYEVSNFSKRNKESKHNINYWIGGNYYGVGLAAHSHIDGRRYWNVSRLTEYMKKVQEGRSVEDGFEVLSKEERFMECILFGLRMNEGVNIKFVSNQYQCSMSDEMNQKINEFINNGFLFYKKGFLKATDQGRLVLDEISAKLI